MTTVTELDPRPARILRMLIYPIQFDANPLNGIDRVLDQVVYAEHLKLSLPDIIAAIDSGLASHARLSELIPQSHTESVIRGFLSALRNRLEIELKKT
jgi:hypothetical protein